MTKCIIEEEAECVWSSGHHCSRANGHSFIYLFSFLYITFVSFLFKVITESGPCHAITYAWTRFLSVQAINWDSLFSPYGGRKYF